MAQRIVLIPKSYGDAEDVLRREMEKRGIDPSKIKLKIKEIVGDSVVVINWVVQYVNTTGRRGFASHVSKSGKSMVSSSGNSLRIAEFRASDYSSLTPNGAKVSITSEVYKVEAKDYLWSELSSSLRVPKRAVYFVDISKVIIAKRVVYAFEVGENYGEVEIGKGLPEVRLKPLPLSRLEEKALASLRRYTKNLAGSEEVGKIAISRSWDFLFNGKGKSQIKEGFKRDTRPPEIIIKDLDENNANFISRVGGKFFFIQLNRYSGEITAELPVVGPEDLKMRIMNAFKEIASADLSEVELVSEGISDLYRPERGPKGVSIVSEVKLRALPYIYYVRYEHSSGKLSILGKEVDEAALRRFLINAFGEVGLHYEYEGSLLYVRVKKEKGWSFMIFDLARLKGSPDLELLVDRVFRDPGTGSYVIFLRAEGSSGCMVSILSHDLHRNTVLKSPCIEEIAEIVRKEVFQRFKVDARMKAEYEQRVDSVIGGIGPKLLFGSSGKRDAYLHFTGSDPTYGFALKASYSLRSGTVHPEEPRISEITIGEIVRKCLGIREPPILKHKYNYPFLKVRTRIGRELVSLKFDLSDISNPSLVERKVIRGFLDKVRDLFGFLLALLFSSYVPG